MKLLVFGYFGSGNLGDEAILFAFKSWCEKHLSGTELIVQSADPEGTRRDHGVRAVGKFSLPGVMRALFQCDALVAPGGGLLQDATSSKSLLYYLWLMRMAQLLGKPVFLLSQGIGPLTRAAGRRRTALALRRCRHVAVRDEKSFELLKTLGVPGEIVDRSGDLVLLAEPGQGGDEDAQEPHGDTLRVGLSLRPNQDLDHLVGVLLSCLLRMNEKQKLELRLFPLSRDEDLPLLDDFAARIMKRSPELPVRMIAGEQSGGLTVPEMEKAVSELDLMLGMRLHSLVFSARNGVPFIGLSYDPKVAVFAQECRQPVVERLGAAEPVDLMRKMETALHGGRAGVEAMNATLDASRQALARSMEKFLTILSREVQGPRPIMSVPVSQLSFEQTMAYIRHTVQAGEKLHIVTVNPEMLMNARSDANFRSLLKGAGLNTADGVGARLAFWLKFGRRIEKVAGVELLERLLSDSSRRGLRLFLLGAKPEVIEAAVKKSAAMTPRPDVVGYHHGYLADVAPDALVREINDAGPNIICVGMGSPAQEQWIRDNMGRVCANVFIGVGGSFDVLACAARRAPGWVQAMGMEWLYRVIREPKRIRRIAGFPLFILLILYETLVFRLFQKN